MKKSMIGKNNSQLNSFQHYVPRFLLEYFCSDNMLWVYDRNTKSFRTQPSKATAGETAFYVFTDKEGTKNATVEEMFGKIESVAAPIIQKLVAGKSCLDDQEKADLAMFVAALYIRVPESIKRSEYMGIQMTKEMMSRIVMFDGYFNKSMDEIEKKNGEKITQEQRKEIQKSFRDKEYEIAFPKGYALATLISNLTEFYKIMVQMEWVLLRPPKGKAFICSDKPAFTFNPRPEGFWGSGVGLLAPNCESTVILSPRLAIYLSQNHNPNSVKSVEAPSKLIDSLNGRVAIVSHRFVFSHSEELLKRWVERVKLDQRGPYIQVKIS